MKKAILVGVVVGVIALGSGAAALKLSEGQEPAALGLSVPGSGVADALPGDAPAVNDMVLPGYEHLVSDTEALGGEPLPGSDAAISWMYDGT